MDVRTIITGQLDENCYLLIKEGKCVIIDPGDDILDIKKAIGKLEVLAVLITHHHFDHVGALSPLLEDYKVPVYDFASSQEKEYKIGPFQFWIVFNAGHSKDSIRFVFPKEKVMFVGDFIFYESIGRCDLPGGDFTEMKKSIRELIKENTNYSLYPGHGCKTTLEHEKKWNPYFVKI